MSRFWIGTLHKPVIMYLVPCNTLCLYLFTTMVCWLKLASHQGSQSSLIDMRELYSSPGKMWASLDSSGNVFKAILYPLLDFSIWSLGYFTRIGDSSRSDTSCGESAFK